MLTVETIMKVRLAAKRDGTPLREIARKYRLSRNTVKKYLKNGETGPEYKRKTEFKPKFGPYVAELERLLEEDLKEPKRDRRSAQMLFEELQRQGYQGAYDSVRRHVKGWKVGKNAVSGVFVPLSFEPGEAFQFDWSEETLLLGVGTPVKVSVAQCRLCHSRMPICITYPRESFEMVTDAHLRAFSFFGGVCGRGIYDNMKTVVTKILIGKNREFNRKFMSMASHYLFEPVACTPSAGWEKGQVENQVGLVRGRFFAKRRRFADLDEANSFLASECLAWAKTQKHPEQSDRTIWEVYTEDERKKLIRLDLPFDGFAERNVRITATSLISFDSNKYSVDSASMAKTAEIRAYADRVVILGNGEIIGEHRRLFGKNKTAYNPWHYLPVLERKPGALRNGAPFKDWDLPSAIKELWKALAKRPGGDREFVNILVAIKTHGVDNVECAVIQAIAMGAFSFDVVFNILSRQTEGKPIEESEGLPDHLVLGQLPIADCSRYDSLLGVNYHVT